MRIEVNIDNVPEKITDFFALFCDTMKSEIEKRKKEEKKSIPGYGYYLLKNGDKAIEGDQYYDYTNNKWYKSSLYKTFENISSSSILGGYRRLIPIPSGYILVPEGDPIKKGYKRIDPSNSISYWIWETLPDNCVNKMIEGYTYCKPITKISDSNWFKTCEDEYTVKLWNFKNEKEADIFTLWLAKNEGRLMALQILEDKIEEKNNGWKPYFGDSSAKYCFHNNNGDILNIETWAFKMNTSSTLYFKSRQIGKELIEELGEGLIKQALGF